MTLRTYLNAQRGRASAMARYLQLSPGLVSMWASQSRKVPAQYAFKIERFTKGAVLVESLCPEISFKRYTRST